MSHLSRMSATVIAMAAVGVVAISPPERPAMAQPDKKPAEIKPVGSDFAYVPTDAIGVVHLRLGDLLKSEGFGLYLKVLGKADSKVLDILKNGFAIDPLTIETYTAVALPIAAGNPEPQMVSVIAFSKPYDKTKILATEFSGMKPKVAGKKEYYLERETGYSFSDDRHVIIGPEASLVAYLTHPENPNGKFRERLRADAAGKLIYATGDLSRIPIPAQAANAVPAEYRALLKAKFATLSVDNRAPTAKIDFHLTFANADDAADGEKSALQATQLARSFIPNLKKDIEAKLTASQPADGVRKLETYPDVFGMAMVLGGLNTADEWLAAPPLKRDGQKLAMTVEVPEMSSTTYLGVSSIAVGLLLPAVQKVREAAARAQATNHLKQLGLAMHNYHDTFMRLPPAAIVDKNGKPLLSWRVAILPYLEQGELYRKFKLDEPWDSENNKPLIALMPKLYTDPRSPTEPGLTYFKVFNGKGAMFDGAKGLNLAAIRDGSSNTVMIGAGGDAVIWTKPDDYVFEADKPLPELMKPFPQWLAVFGDGHVQVIRVMNQKNLKAMITVDGGEVVDLE